MKKKIYFITQAKGGTGKSVLAFMLAEKYREAVILDLDDATTTTIKQLAYRSRSRFHFLIRRQNELIEVLLMDSLKVS
jgi:cellulose biosynthesis protein BcsQ